MIVLDTHIWIWWANADPLLPPQVESYIQSESPGGLGVSAISCWEVAKLVERGRLVLTIPLHRWIEIALQLPVRLLPLDPAIAVGSTQATRIIPPRSG